ncbi:BNR repeat-containing protein [Niabella terrae]
MKGVSWKGWVLLLLLLPLVGSAQQLSPVGTGWAANSVNTVVFRKNALTSRSGYQFTAYYDSTGAVVLAKRLLTDRDWKVLKTRFKGQVSDAHRSISLAVDGDGYLHVSWDHHDSKLNYARSLRPLSLEMGAPESMTGKNEQRVTYPEFYNLPDGGLLFLYRDGASGNGSLIINRYDKRVRTWSQIQQNLIDGEGQRNAYWQAVVDRKGRIHISWVWRESPDVASNHDLCYARSRDGGRTWEKSTGARYRLPITAANAEYACRISQGAELINQTSMTTTEAGLPLIATYWRQQGDSVPQYHLVFNAGRGWQSQTLGFRKTAFSLSGGGTKRIPISRPQVITWQHRGKTAAGLIFRDEERQNYISMAVNRNLEQNQWQLTDLLASDCGSYEPLYDSQLWEKSRKLQLFVQRTDQADQEGTSNMPPQPVMVLECPDSIYR